MPQFWNLQRTYKEFNLITVLDSETEGFFSLRPVLETLWTQPAAIVTRAQHTTRVWRLLTVLRTARLELYLNGIIL